MKYDYKTLYQKNVAFYEKRPLAKKLLLKSSHILTAIFMLAYALFILISFKAEFFAQELTNVLFVPCLGFFITSVVRLCVDKARPYSEQGAGITPMVEKKNSDMKSFPSRHTACAFVIAMVFLCHLPAVGILMLVLSTLLAYIRFALGLHYPSDLFFGALIGIACGSLIFIL